MNALAPPALAQTRASHAQVPTPCAGDVPVIPTPIAGPRGLARDAFALPQGTYLCGHSLGPMPKAAPALVAEEMLRWSQLGVRGHFSGDPAWVNVTSPLQRTLSRLAGAQPDEVVAMNALSVNLHLLLCSFHRPRGHRRRILLGPRPFPSDRLVVETHCALQGLDPKDDVCEAASPESSATLTDVMVQEIQRQGDRLALVWADAVDYITGEVLDLHAVTAAAHAVGARVGFDLAHAIGNVPLDLHAAGADFAVWCSYKYLNAGPGALAGAFIHRRHHGDATPRISGWWGIEPADRFSWDGAPRRASPNAEAWQLSNPPVLQATVLRAALEVFEHVDAASRHAHGQALHQTAREGVMAAAAGRVTLLTPDDPARRGQMLALRIHGPGPGLGAGAALERALMDRGIAVDVRGDVLRATFCSLYNTLDDVQQFVSALERAL